MSGGGKGQSEQTVTQRVEIPQFLEGLTSSQANVAQGALGNLQDRLQGDTVADLTPEQLEAFDIGTQRARGAGGFIPTAQQTFLDAAQGNLGFGVGQPGIEQLQQTAAGENRAGFNEAFNAAVNQLNPQIRSEFALAGRTGSGLEAAAQQQAVSDAFARLFNQRRNREVSAGRTLADLGLQGQSQQINAAQQLPGIGLADVDVLSSIGSRLQQQRQREIQGPIQAQQQLIQASGGPVPLGSLLGQSKTQPLNQGSPIIGALGGGLTGAELAGELDFLPTPVGAGIGVLGGLLS